MRIIKGTTILLYVGDTKGNTRSLNYSSYGSSKHGGVHAMFTTSRILTNQDPYSGRDMQVDLLD